MARKHKRHSLDEFWVGVMPKPQEPEKKSKQKKVQKITDIDAANKAISRWHGRVEKKAIIMAQKYCSAFYKEEFRKALKQAMRQTHLSKSERMRRARLPIGVGGGFMGFARDEIIPDYKVNSLEEYEPYIANIGLDDPQKLLRKWRDEAECEIPFPDIEFIEDEEPVEFLMPDILLRSNRLMGFRQRKKINTDGCEV